MFFLAPFLGVFLILAGCQKQAVTEESSLFPVKAITHSHGLAINLSDSNKLHIATHRGLLVLINEKELYQIGKDQDDYMGFSIHPKEPKVFFSSGHPKTGGNIGVQRSDDAGITWKKISNGVNGPVDFHAMTVSGANPNLLYGWYGGLQRSQDGGKTWEALSTDLQKVIFLLAHPTEENTVYAATAKGLLGSSNKGISWASLSKDLEGDAVIAFGIDPNTPTHMLSFSEKMGLAKSTDEGKTWKKIVQDFGTIMYFAFDPKNPGMVYALNEANKIYKSQDSGNTWTKIY